MLASEIRLSRRTFAPFKPPAHPAGMVSTGIWVAAAIGLVAYFAVFGLLYGPILTPDGERLMAAAEVLREFNFNPVRFSTERESLSGFDHWVPLRHYFLYLTLLAALGSGFGAGWLTALVAANAVAHGITATIVLAAAHRIGGMVSLCVATALLVVLFESYQWVAMSQSEPLFTVFTTSAIAAAVGAAIQDSGRGRVLFWVAAAGFTAAAVLTRPTWPPVVVTVLTIALLSGRLRRGDAASAVRLWVLLGCAAAVATVMLIFGAAAVALDPSLAPTRDIGAAMDDWRPWYAQGMVVLFRPETYLPAEESLWGFVRVSFARLAYFFWFTADGFSAAHRWINVAGHVPLYALAIIGTFAVVRIRHLSRLGLTLGLAALTHVLAADAFHAITFVDFDWRYRAPTYPALVVLAAIGAALVWRSRRSTGVAVPLGKTE
jgi:hypothetical protein